MDGTPADRWIGRTKDRIKRALIKLLLKKDLKDITVRELTGLADINRGTFYLHYHDVPALFREIEEELVEEFSQYIVKYKNHSAFLRMPVLGDLFQYVALNREVCSALLRSRDSTFIAQILELNRPGTPDEFRRYYKHWDEKYCDYYYDFISNGTLAMLRRWLEAGMKESVEQMTLMVDKMISNCIENIT
ncbi:MAG: TetR family transcriptional regulator C-terminal domain-containing protein [Treponema sp.]|nr:TetR family transcriptional regulator C-terminal domain-containing protein [Treponema sp.]